MEATFLVLGEKAKGHAWVAANITIIVNHNPLILAMTLLVMRSISKMKLPKKIFQL
jgi:hypothetical protein